MLRKHEAAVVEFRWIIQFCDRDRSVLKSEYEVEPDAIYNEAGEGLSESLCCLGRFAETHDAAQRALAGPGLAESIQQALTRRMERCRQLSPSKRGFPRCWPAKSRPATSRLSLRLPNGSSRISIVLMRQSNFIRPFSPNSRRWPTIWIRKIAFWPLVPRGRLVADWRRHRRFDEAVKAGLASGRLAWLAAERDACEKLFLSGADAVRLRAVKAMAACQGSRNLDCVRDQAALAKLPAAESTFGKSCGWSRRDRQARPAVALNKLAPAARKQWVKAVEYYTDYIHESRTNNGEIWFECAAVQLLASSRAAYRQTCRQMLDGLPGLPKMRSYLVARACTLSPGSTADPGLPVSSAAELTQFAASYWSLTEQAH